MRDPNRITRVEISEKNKKLRIILIAVLLAVGFVAIGAGFMGLLNRDTGWQEVEVVTSEANCSPDFILQYQFSGSGAEATTLYKQISAVYTEGCIKAYELFQVDVPSEDYENLYDINHNVNKTLTVDPVLYKAFEKLQDTRYLYLGPVYAHYNSLIFNTADELVEELDPALSGEAKAYVQKLADFAASEESVQLRLLGGNQVCLQVSDDYLAFAEENEIENFIDFRYMANAFIIDYLAQSLTDAGFTRGCLSSCDGYTRNLDSQENFSFNIYARQENTIYPAAVMTYRGPVSMVYLKDYQMAASDAYYRQSGDHLVHTLVDGSDGMYRTSIPQLVSYSYTDSCVDVLLAMLPGFVSAEFRLPQGVESVWCDGNTVCYTDEAIRFTKLLQDEEIQFTVQLRK